MLTIYDFSSTDTCNGDLPMQEQRLWFTSKMQLYRKHYVMYGTVLCLCWSPWSRKGLISSRQQLKLVLLSPLEYIVYRPSFIVNGSEIGLIYLMVLFLIFLIY